MQKQHKPLVLILGATGRTGFHITNKLLNQQYPVRIFARSTEKVKTLFSQNQHKFQNIIEGNIIDIQCLERAFGPSQKFGKVSFVISALGATLQRNQSIEEIQFKSQVKIVNMCKQYNISKYIIVSSALLQRPWNMIAVFLNNLGGSGDVLHWKLQAENYIRNSGINYAIVRPTQLTGDFKDSKITNYQIDQGDRVMGAITRATVAQVVYDSMTNSNIPDKVTFQCTQNKNSNEPLSFANLKMDSQKNIEANHILAKRLYNVFCCCCCCPIACCSSWFSKSND